MQEEQAAALQICHEETCPLCWRLVSRLWVQAQKNRLLLWRIKKKTKQQETSPLLQRRRKLNEPFTSSPFSSGEVVKVFYWLLPLFMMRRRKRQLIKYLMWKSWSLLCAEVSLILMCLFSYSVFICWVDCLLIVKWLLCNSVIEMISTSVPLALELRMGGQPKLDNSSSYLIFLEKNTLQRDACQEDYDIPALKQSLWPGWFGDPTENWCPDLSCWEL